MDTTFRAVAETVTDAVISADIHGRITYVNKGGERLFGWTTSELSGRPLTLLIPQRLRGTHWRGLLRYATAEGGRPSGTVELVGLRKDGGEFPVEISLARSGETSGVSFTAIIRDITERRRRDEELRAINTQLEAANRELEAFSYSVSHDLRAPVRSIHGFTEILQQDYADRLDDRGRDCLHRVHAAAERMFTLIDAMLILSRVTREEMRQEVVDLSALARSVATDLHRADPDRNVDLAIASGLVAIGDASLVRVVLENLLGNAWKFTSRAHAPRVEFGVTSETGTEAYFVRDNGAGFDMTHVDRLFTTFQRLHTTDEFPGTGIGLPTVQRIVHRHGGRVWAEGRPGSGATFYFTLAPDARTGAAHHVETTQASS
jgi:PAS domain S-box-containing protein